MPLISVIIPIYNAGKYLTPCIESVINQSYRNLEIILIDDGSKDNSLAICQQYAQEDERISVIAKENGGVSSARNAGLAVCHGQWVSFVDSDDFLELDAYEHCAHIISQHSCEAVCFEFYATFPTHENKHSMSPERYGVLNRKESMYLLHGGLPFTWCRIFRRDIIGDTLFDTGIARGEDGKFNTQVLHRANAVYFTDKALYHYVQSEESACRGKFRPIQLTAMKLIDFYPAFFSEHYPELLQPWYCKMCHLIVTLYYDMYADEMPYPEEREAAMQKYRSVYDKIDFRTCTTKGRIKFRFFRYFPKTFCFFHSVSMKLRQVATSR